MLHPVGEYNFSDEGLLVTTYKSVLKPRESLTRKDFFIWGPSDFLYVERTDSLSSVPSFNSASLRASGHRTDQAIEPRYLYLYKDSKTSFFPTLSLDWIFAPDPVKPLMVLSLLKSEDFSTISDRIRSSAASNEFALDLFRSLGQNAGVLVTRSQTYSQVLDLLIKLNLAGDNTYSIAGVENPMSRAKSGSVHHGPLFPKLHALPFDAMIRDYVSINFNLVDGGKAGTRIDEALRAMQASYETVMKTLKKPTNLLTLTKRFELGRFDLEVCLDGHIACVLELLLHPQHGLVNITSPFHTNFVTESRTTWKSPVPLNTTGGT